ncbi:phage major tail tube protein [Labrenzia sp. R4_2]|uniref:phage major tail tube protein n=1 Tax=Labrenzia sp. R4_2 TaxID=2821107 RepID=UPI001ADB8821|nr:phage major tail tube protein [Labrenzia sp. R4_2]MBO9422396.1 phage major tail tube protein [Labrenzia sp. R4_2]
MEFGKQQEELTVWIDDMDLGGSVSSVKPIIKRKTESRRPGGSRGSLMSFHGFEELGVELVFTTLTPKLFELLPSRTLSQKTLFARGSFIDEFTGEVSSLVHEFRGRCTNPDFGMEHKAGEPIELTVEMALVFYREEFAGAEKIYIDLRNNIVRMNGEDETEATNAALGR